MCMLTDSTAAVVAAAASAAAAAGCAAASTVLLLLACCAGAGAGAGAGAAAPAAAHRHRHQHRRDRRRHRQGQGVSKPAGAGPARSQQEEGLGESRVAHVPSDAGSAPRSVACFGPAPSSEALCYSMKSSHPPPQPHASAAPAWVGMAIRPRSWSREHQSDCGEAHALPVAPAHAPLRQQRHLQVDGPRRAHTQTKGPALGCGVCDAIAFFSRGRLPPQVTVS